MSLQTPPRWLETLLLRCLAARDRDTISGDLLEEYREVQVPKLGPRGANIWYAHQLIGFLAVRCLGESTMRASLTWMCMLTALAGIWLAVMESILKHPGYLARAMVAGCIVIQGLATLLFLMWHGRALFRVLILAGAVAAAVLGASAVIQTLNAPHFEGFVLLIGTALIVQGAIALVVVGSARASTTA